MFIRTCETGMKYVESKKENFLQNNQTIIAYTSKFIIWNDYEQKITMIGLNGRIPKNVNPQNHIHTLH